MQGELAGEGKNGDGPISRREQALRAWFVRDVGPIRREIDSLDIGWGGVQRWATARMPSIEGLHLDLACGYATFLAYLGWRHPSARLVGLNIDYNGPHALARSLLHAAGVRAALVQADARHVPFPSETFPSVSCFLGLQDIAIGFGEAGVSATVVEAVRVLRPGGILVLLDEDLLVRWGDMLNGLPVTVVDRAERGLDVRWTRQVALAAVRLYAEGWVAQMQLPGDDRAARQTAYEETLARMEAEVEEQVTRQGYYVPFGPVQMVVVRKDQGRSGPV
jgi:SAM-dependent methyltransferase